MKKLLLLTFSVLALCTTTLAQESDELVKEIMEKAQVNEEQAMGGAGALFGMAKENMEKTDFDKVSDAIPNMDGLLDAVPSLGGGGSTMLGSAAIQLSGTPKVLAAFDKLGISQDKVATFSPILVGYVERKGGKAISDLLNKALQ